MSEKIYTCYCGEIAARRLGLVSAVKKGHGTFYCEAAPNVPQGKNAPADDHGYISADGSKRPAAVPPYHRELLQEAVDRWPEAFSDDEPEISGGDAVEWLVEWLGRVKSALTVC